MIQNNLLSVDIFSILKRRQKRSKLNAFFKGYIKNDYKSNDILFIFDIPERTAFLEEQCSVAVFSLEILPQLTKLFPSLFAMLQTFVQFDDYHSRLLYFNIVTWRQKSWKTH